MHPNKPPETAHVTRLGHHQEAARAASDEPVSRLIYRTKTRRIPVLREANRKGIQLSHYQSASIGAFEPDAIFTVAFILTRFGATTLSAILPDNGQIRSIWLCRFNATSVAEWVSKHNNLGWNIYFVPNRPLDGLSKKPRRSEIVELRAVYGDVDAKNGRSLEDCLKAIFALALPPNFICMSGGGWQPFYLLDTPLISNSEGIRQAEAIGRGLSGALNGDTVQSVEHLMRAPYTTNFPDTGKRKRGRVPVTAGIIFPNANVPKYSASKLAAAFPAVDSIGPTKAPNRSNVRTRFLDPSPQAMRLRVHLEKCHGLLGLAIRAAIAETQHGERHYMMRACISRLVAAAWPDADVLKQIVSAAISAWPEEDPVGLANRTKNILAWIREEEAKKAASIAPSSERMRRALFGFGGSRRPAQ